MGAGLVVIDKPKVSGLKFHGLLCLLLSLFFKCQSL